MNEEMEAELTEMDSKTDHIAVKRKMLMNLFQLVLEKNEVHYHIRRK